ncbi:MAG: hypothetical protein AAF909_13545 [Pseudomonadota bacterium]
MFTLAGTFIGFVAMLVARGRAGIAAGLAFLGFVLGVVSSVVFIFEQGSSAVEQAGDPQGVVDAMLNVDWSISSYIALAAAAAPGVLGALFARRD